MAAYRLWTLTDTSLVEIRKVREKVQGRFRTPTNRARTRFSYPGRGFSHVDISDKDAPRPWAG